MNENELKECPFLCYNPLEHGLSVCKCFEDRWFVVCMCGAQGPWGASAKEAIESWNTRFQQQEIDRLKSEWREPDENTPRRSPCWLSDDLGQWWLGEHSPVIHGGRTVVLAKEGQGPPPDDWRPQKEKVCPECGSNKRNTSYPSPINKGTFCENEWHESPTQEGESYEN